MPKLSPTMTEGTVARWHKVEGDFVDSGELLLDIGTDKATIEHHVIDPGWLRKILVKEGDRIEVGKPLAILTDEKDEAITEHKPDVVAAPPPPTIVEKSTPSPAQKIEKVERILASPLAKKIARQKGLSLEGISGTGPGGRIMRRDLEQTVAAPTEEKMSSMRRTIASRLQQSKATIPHFYVAISVNAKSLLSLKDELKASGRHITVNDLILKATAVALSQHPSIRSSFDPQNSVIQRHAHADIAVAVAVPGGLITPIVFGAEEKSIQKISEEVRSLSEKAKAGKLQPHEYVGGAFTISNLGMFGVDEFYAIINPPQVAILAIGAARDVPVVEGEKVVAGKVMKLTLSVDHRAVDGSDAALFLKTLKDLLEHPSVLLL
jgi:pyruvate dehydrogenase E2 component (dihydrolipoamide acetyltransferase)